MPRKPNSRTGSSAATRMCEGTTVRSRISFYELRRQAERADHQASGKQRQADLAQVDAWPSRLRQFWDEGWDTVTGDCRAAQRIALRFQESLPCLLAGNVCGNAANGIQCFREELTCIVIVAAFGTHSCDSREEPECAILRQRSCAAAPQQRTAPLTHRAICPSMVRAPAKLSE